MSSRFIHVVTYVRIPFLLETEYYSTVCTDRILFIHSSADGQLGCFHLLAPVNNAAINMVYKYLLLGQMVILGLIF